MVGYKGPFWHCPTQFAHEHFLLLYIVANRLKETKFDLTLLANSTIELAVMSAGRLLALRLQVPPSLFQRLPRHEDFRWVAVGMPVTQHPPHRSRRAALPHRAPASGLRAGTRRCLPYAAERM